MAAEHLAPGKAVHVVGGMEPGVADGVAALVASADAGSAVAGAAVKSVVAGVAAVNSVVAGKVGGARNDLFCGACQKAEACGCGRDSVCVCAWKTMASWQSHRARVCLHWAQPC